MGVNKSFSHMYHFHMYINGLVCLPFFFTDPNHSIYANDANIQKQFEEIVNSLHPKIIYPHDFCFTVRRLHTIQLNSFFFLSRTNKKYRSLQQRRVLMLKFKKYFFGS